MAEDAAFEQAQAARRRRMVEHDLRRRGIRDRRVLVAMARVPRHRFVPPDLVRVAYDDCPLPIGEGQTISQPYIVARMTEALRLQPNAKVLEIGTGSGYQTAVLAECGARVWTVERSPCLAEEARVRLAALGYGAITFAIGDGTLGLPSVAPFDRILATGSLPDVASPLLQQLRDEGVFVGPVGSLDDQELIRIVYDRGRELRDWLGACRFVPLIGSRGWREGRWAGGSHA